MSVLAFDGDPEAQVDAVFVHVYVGLLQRVDIGLEKLFAAAPPALGDHLLRRIEGNAQAGGQDPEGQHVLGLHRLDDGLRDRLERHADLRQRQAFVRVAFVRIVDNDAGWLDLAHVNVVVLLVPDHQDVQGVARRAHGRVLHPDLGHGRAALDFGGKVLEGIDVQTGPGQRFGQHVADGKHAFAVLAGDAYSQVKLIHQTALGDLQAGSNPQNHLIIWS